MITKNSAIDSAESFDPEFMTEGLVAGRNPRSKNDTLDPLILKLLFIGLTHTSKPI